jgi:4-carboxymuconolactone decarboxylase
VSTEEQGLSNDSADSLAIIRSLFLESAAAVPAEIRDDWAHYVKAIVLDGMWTRPVLSKRDRSMITVAAVAAMRCPAELQTQVRAALANDLSSRVLCEVMLHVGGYAGLGVAREGLLVLGQVLGSNGVAGSAAHEQDERRGVSDGADRFVRGKAVLATLQPERADLPPPVPPPFAPDWPRWLRETAFGDLWSRPHLNLIGRERITMAVLMVLNRPEELLSHFRIASSLGIPAVEVGEEIMHLAIYAGFPAAVDAMRIATGVFGQNGEAARTAKADDQT